MSSENISEEKNATNKQDIINENSTCPNKMEDHDFQERISSNGEQNDPEENTSEELDEEEREQTSVECNYPEVEIVRPVVEWIYPNGPPPVHEPIDQDLTNQIQHDSVNDSPYIVDPANTDVIQTVDGEIVPDRRCFVKAFGFTIFDDTFPYKLNPKLYPLLLGMLCLATVATVAVVFVTDSANAESSVSMSSSDLNIVLISTSPSYDPSNIPSSFPSTIPSHEAVDMRVFNITKALLDVSGEVMLQNNSSQNKALQWILEQDGMNLTHDSSNLVQRYTLMVLYHNTRGEEWFTQDGYGSDTHECDWYGIHCHSNKLLEIVSLKYNNLQGQIPKEIGALTRLDTLELLNNRIDGTMPSEIGKLQYLTLLRLAENMISGTVPDEIGDCKSLNKLRLGSNKLTGSIPTSVGNLRFLHRLALANNNLSGSIPSDMSRLSSLTFLYLDDNKLTGSIPTELGSLTSLTELWLYRNSLIGTIPSSFGNLESIQFLLLDHNMLTGTIPSNLHQCTKLIELNLNNNLLFSTIPASIGFVSNLERINLSWNHISGTVPSEIGKLNNLVALELDHNMLAGNVPLEVCDLSIGKVAADCANNTLGIVCSCCTICY